MADCKVVQKYSHTIAVAHNDARIVYAGATWETDTRSTAINGSHTYTDTANATATLTFSGDYVGVVMESGTYSGIAEIILDGISQGNFDCYSPYTYYPFVYFTKKLTFGEHTIQVKVTGTKNTSSSGAYIWFDHFFYNIDRYDITVSQQSGVILTFDDTRTSAYDYAIPKLEEYGFKATCFINPGVCMDKTITSDSTLDRWKIYFLRVHDFEVSSHSYEHIDLTALTEDEVRTSLRKSIEWLQNNGMDSGHFAAPFNSINDTVSKVIKEFHCSASIGGDISFNRYEFNPYYMPRYNVQETTDITVLKAELDNVKANNKVITLYFHDITEYTATSPNISKTKFDEIIDYIATIGLKGMRMKDFLPL